MDAPVLYMAIAKRDIVRTAIEEMPRSLILCRISNMDQIVESVATECNDASAIGLRSRRDIT